MTNVIAIKITLRMIISTVGDTEVEETKRGKNAMKNIDNLGLRILIRKPLHTICQPVPEEGELNFNEPVSRHIDQAR